MVVFCKRCGTPVKLDNARLTDPAYSAKCQQCQRVVAMDTVRASAPKAVAAPGTVAPAASTSAAPGTGTAPAPAAEEHAQTQDKSHYLQKIRLFSGLPYDECLLIESRLRPCEFAPQQTIVKEGGPADAMYFITSGAVEVRKKDPHTGIDFLLTELKAGSCFGEMALLTGKPRAASVVAVEPTSCSVLGHAAFDEVLLTSSKLGLAMSRVLAERLEEADQQTGSEHIHAATSTDLPRKGEEKAEQNLVESLQAEAQKPLEVEEEGPSSEGVTDLSLSPTDAPIVRIANSILALAIKKGASDIHLEPQEKDLAVRFRIDGALYVVQVLPKKVQMGLISRIKTLAKLNPAERRLPQDGRISLRVEERSVDLGVASIPCRWGEKICLRIHDKSDALPGLDKLILHPQVLEQVREMIAQPSGIIYVTGPTDSGKTTLLYSALAELNKPEVNISTAEDPIEYSLPGVNQVETNKEIGLDFAQVLRAFMRQEPDIILVGDTRDKETMRIAVEAALAGRLVLTTLTAKDAASAFAGLGEMGLDLFLAPRSTIGVIALRLARRLCQACKETCAPDDSSLQYLGLDPSEPHTFYRHRGCDQCSGTGYRGRVGIYEVLRLNADLRRLVAGGANAEAITALAVQTGMKTLKDYAAWLLQNGWTTMDEVLRVVSV